MWNQFIVDWQNGNQRSMVDPKDEEIKNLKEELQDLKEELLENEEKINNAKHVKTKTLNNQKVA